MQGVAVAIDEDRDAILANALRDARHRFAAHVGKVLERRLGPALERTLVVGTQAVGRHLQPRAVDLLEELRRQMHRRMVAKIGRYECDPQAFARGDVDDGAAGAPNRGEHTRPALGDVELRERRQWHGERGKGVDRNRSLSTFAR